MKLRVETPAKICVPLHTRPPALVSLAVSSRPSRGVPWARPRHELLLLVLVAVAALTPINVVSEQDRSRLCLTQALTHGRISNDPCFAATRDRAEFDGHLYTDKAPGVSVLALPA